MNAMTALQLKLGITSYNLEVADTLIAHRQGLAGYLHLPSNWGMLFVFETDEIRTFWMYRMNFPLDIIWINSNGVVVGLTENTQLPTDSNRIDLPIYISPLPCRYVIELNAGSVADSEIHIGDMVVGLPKDTTVIIIQKSESSYLVDFSKWLELQFSGTVATTSDSGVFTPTFGRVKTKSKKISKEDNGCSECIIECSCVLENGCICDHDCICSDLTLGRDCAEFFFSVNDLEKLSSAIINKAVIQTPTDTKTGRFVADKVPTGASVWITITNPESPLHGRHILITRRPDGLFALTGGAGQGDDEVAARKHIVLTGTPKKTKRDLELEEIIDEAKQYNAPLIEARKEIEQAARSEISTAAKQMTSSLGLKELNKKQLLQHKDDIQNHIESLLGEEEKAQAKRMTDTIMRYAVQSEKQIRQRTQAERELAIVKIGSKLAQLKGEEIQHAIDLEHLPQDQYAISLPDIKGLQGLSASQQELAISQYFAEQADNFFDPDRIVHTDEKDVPQIVLGESIEKLNIVSPDQFNQSLDHIKGYWEKRNQVDQIKQEFRKIPLTAVSASTLTSIKTAITALPEASMSLTDIEQKAKTELNNWVNSSSTLKFYDAVGEFWNDDKSLVDTLNDKGKYDSTMKFHLDAGATTALAALSKQHLGITIDTAKLIQNANVEAATATLALGARLKYKYDSAGYEKLVNDVKQFNISNQNETERRALDRHSQLKGHYEDIQRQKANSEILDKVRISSLEADNLIEQRKNIGAALGSLQASATFYDYLNKFRTSKDYVVNMNVGNDYQEAIALVNRLGLKEKNYAIDAITDPDNISIRVGIGSLDRQITIEKDLTTQHDNYEKIKTDMSGVIEDEAGNLIVENYDVPLWKKTYVDDAGVSHDYNWRVEQRNDMNWLLAVTDQTNENPTGKGGGLVTRVTGAGKTNTALGFMANQIDRDKNYKGLVVVPKGRAQQWYDEAKRFTKLNIELIPDGLAKDKVNEILAKSKPGTIYITGHREAARSNEALEAMQTNHSLGLKFDGVVIDEPQELQARGQSGNIGVLGKRLMRLPMRHRIGLTATPARRSPLEAYDLIKWTSQSKDLGSKASFNRTFSGFSSGTNAQDTAISKLYFDTVKPYISGDRLTSPSFKVKHDSVNVGRSAVQIRQQKSIESASAAFITTRRQEIINTIKDNPNHQFRRSRNWEIRLPQYATDIARREVMLRHVENLDNGDYKTNSKLSLLKSTLDKDRDKKHVIFIDSKVQRNSILELLKDSGYTSSQIKNIAATTTSITGTDMAQRVKDFRTNPKTNVILIDSKSSSGYNLNQGDALHIVGSPVDASVYLQAQGRVARMPRKGDVDIYTYRYKDNPVEQAHWNNIDAQLKILRASSPGLFVGQT